MWPCNCYWQARSHSGTGGGGARAPQNVQDRLNCLRPLPRTSIDYMYVPPPQKKKKHNNNNKQTNKQTHQTKQTNIKLWLRAWLLAVDILDPTAAAANVTEAHLCFSILLRLSHVRSREHCQHKPLTSTSWTDHRPFPFTIRYVLKGCIVWPFMNIHVFAKLGKMFAFTKWKNYGGGWMKWT